MSNNSEISTIEQDDLDILAPTSHAYKEHPQKTTKNMDYQLIYTIEQAIEKLEEEMQKNLSGYMEVLLDSSEDGIKEATRLEKQKDSLQEKLERLTTQKLNIEKKYRIHVPKNIPLLHFADDIDNVKDSTVAYDNIDSFLRTFEMVMYQHKLDLDLAWESCFISAVQHSMDKSTWYQQNLMNKCPNWQTAKQMINKLHLKK